MIYNVQGTLWAVGFDIDRLETTVGVPFPVQEGVLAKPSGATNFDLATEEDEGGVLWIYDLFGDSQIQQLTFEGDSQRPVWTPDSRRITFSSDRDGTMSLYEVPADGSGVPERLTAAEEGTFHWPGSWSPDGQTLLFNVQNGTGGTDWDIWTLSASGRETHSLHATPDTSSYVGAQLSPNGEWLAYGEGPNAGSADIYVEPFPLPPTGATRRISQNGGVWPLWSPDGERLFCRPPLVRAPTDDTSPLRSVDIGNQDGIDFLVMEYLDGETLAQRLDKGALPLDQALQIAIEIADALDKAHRQGIVHRDLKPPRVTGTGAPVNHLGQVGVGLRLEFHAGRRVDRHVTRAHDRGRSRPPPGGRASRSRLDAHVRPVRPTDLASRPPGPSRTTTR